MRTFWNIWDARSARPSVAPYCVSLTHSEERLAKLDRLAVVSEHFGDNAAGFGLNLVHHFHRFDDANDGVFGDGFPTSTKAGALGMQRGKMYPPSAKHLFIGTLPIAFAQALAVQFLRRRLWPHRPPPVQLSPIAKQTASLQLQTEALLFDLKQDRSASHQIDHRFDFFDVFGVQGQLLVKAEAFYEAHALISFADSLQHLRQISALRTHWIIHVALVYLSNHVT